MKRTGVLVGNFEKYQDPAKILHVAISVVSLFHLLKVNPLK